MPSSRGPCRATITRWFYDTKTEKCKPFIYGGCEGNENNFRHELECNIACGSESNITVSTDGGNEGYEKEDMTNIAEGAPYEEEVSVLIIPGCNSNFGCCKDGITPASGPNQIGCPVYESNCTMPKHPGTGSDRIVRWYYNSHERECKIFIYKGQGGNLNNFDNQLACSRECINKVDCKDQLPHICDFWKQRGFCRTQGTILNTYCKKSCGVCT